MLDNRYDLTLVLAEYPVDFRPGAMTVQLHHSGFSGSRIWRIEMADGTFCVRRWPKDRTDFAQLRQVHDVLGEVFHAGFTRIPLPIPAGSGETIVHRDGHFWELTPWLPGEPLDCRPPQKSCSTTQLAAALTALAQFHGAVMARPQKLANTGPAPGILSRGEKLGRLIAGGIDRLAEQIPIRHAAFPELADRSASLIADFRKTADVVADSLSRARHFSVPLQSCIRDIHREHVLFVDGCVTGLIDFGAMRLDSRAGDVARLLGGLAGDDEQSRNFGLAAYNRFHPLDESESQLVRGFDASSVLLSGINWLEWIFLDGRCFENQAAVLSRFDEIATRLSALANRQDPIIV